VTTTSDAEPKPRGLRRWFNFGRVGQASAVVGLIAGIAGLLFTFVPSLRPGSGGAGDEEGTIELASVNERATLREYLDAEGIPPGSISKDVLRRFGVLATVRYSSTGLRGKKLPLDVTLTSRETGEVVCSHREVVEAGSGGALTQRVWAPFPAKPLAPGDVYNLHVTLRRPDAKPPALDAADHNAIPGPSVTNTAAIPLDLCEGAA
jgi:hypothetical protein